MPSVPLARFCRPDGNTLATGSSDKSVWLWNIPQMGDPASFFCNSVGQSFTRNQWQSLDGLIALTMRRGKQPGIVRHPRRRRQPEAHPAGPGSHIRKLAECQEVMEALGDLPLRVAYERLAGMVRMLGDDVQAMALRNAYAIDMPAPDTLTRRRERIAGTHRLSIDTIELYERNMIDELALRLVHGELPVGS
jgi:hypothetical protein